MSPKLAQGVTGRDGMLALMVDVGRFHAACEVPGLPLGDSTIVEDRLALRMRLMTEELNELYTAMTEEVCAVKTADALADLIYVVVGTALEFGIPLHAVWEEVQRANMSKLGPDGKALKDSQGKVLKPEGWTPPDIKSVIDSYRTHGETDAQEEGQEGV